MKHLNSPRVPFFLCIIAIVITTGLYVAKSPHSARSVPEKQVLNINYGDMIQVRPGVTSMLPTIQPGDRVVLAWGNRIKPQVGGIIAFNDYFQGILIHRVIEVGQDKDGWWARTKGDNNPEPDPYLVREINYLGLVWGIVRVY